MSVFRIRGGQRMQGAIEPQGAKNEALQVICAALLTDEPVTLHNMPDIRDVNKLLELVRNIGCRVEKTGHHSWTITASTVDTRFLQTDDYLQMASSLRGSVMLLAPVLVRCGEALLPRPGGDKIGRRRLDTHFLGFRKMGANFEYDAQRQLFRMEAKKLSGAYLLLDEASVTGTANIILAAVRARGTTTIYNAACEPYIQQLCQMLNRMGAKISGIGSNLLTIEGVSQLHGTEHTLLPDMIEVGSFIGIAAMTNSDLTIRNCRVDMLGPIPDVFRKLGIALDIRNDDIHVVPQEYYCIENFIDGSILTISDAPWPGFTPDLLSVALVVATQAQGTVLIHQKMFESRLFFVDKLIEMGAQIILCDPHRATVIGLNRKQPLRAIKMASPDIRAGIALLIAALSAQGTSEISNIEQIDRGYERIDERLRKLGAIIERIP
jgi:UDP-N-acetylglucosamine 1-carboxyvinyltransferase